MKREWVALDHPGTKGISLSTRLDSTLFPCAVISLSTWIWDPGPSPCEHMEAQGGHVICQARKGQLSLGATVLIPKSCITQ
jgi:hypothetical protein